MAAASGAAPQRLRRVSAEEIAAMLDGTPLVVMLDIDGTLCEIVERADDAQVPAETRAALAALESREDAGVHLAFVTGRSVADAQRMLGGDTAVIYGNHGMERFPSAGHDRSRSGSGAGETALRSAAEELTALAARFPGAGLEDKKFSVSLHFRTMDAALVPDLTAGMNRITARHAVRVSPGKCVFNVVPEAAFNKGDAALEIVRDSGADTAGASIVFVGDDVTDEDAFRALRSVPGAVTVRVGSPDATSAAQFSIDAPRDVHELLSLLAESRG